MEVRAACISSGDKLTRNMHQFTCQRIQTVTGVTQATSDCDGFPGTSPGNYLKPAFLNSSEFTYSLALIFRVCCQLPFDTLSDDIVIHFGHHLVSLGLPPGLVEQDDQGM